MNCLLVPIEIEKVASHIHSLLESLVADVKILSAVPVSQLQLTRE